MLRLLCEQLDMSQAFVGSVSGGLHIVDFAVSAENGREPSLETSSPVEQSLSGQVTTDGPLIVTDTAEMATQVALPAGGSRKVQSYVGICLRDPDGEVVGVLGLSRNTPHERLDRRDVDVLEGLASVAGEFYADIDHEAVPVVDQSATGEGDEPPRPPSPAGDLQGLTRPLLDALHELSGIASIFLTVVDGQHDEQQLLLAHNTKEGFVMPEGATIPWKGSMCWLALEEGTPAVFDLPQRWPQVAVAAHLGLVTHVTVPVRLSDGSLWGTLCASDNVAHLDAADHVSTLNLFARLIGSEVERVTVIAGERAQADLAVQLAQTDELTGCSTRRMLQPWLVRALRTVEPDEVVMLVFLDVDRFKAVNDEFGHATGDALLTILGQRLRAAAGPADLVTRLGGDEFVVATRVPRAAVSEVEARIREAGHFQLLTAHRDLSVRCSTGIATSDEGVTLAALLALADTQMYLDKPVTIRT